MENRATLILYFSTGFFPVSCKTSGKIEIDKFEEFSLRRIVFFKTASIFLISQNDVRKNGNTDPKLWVQVCNLRS